MADEFDFFSNDCNNWNYNPFINTPNAGPYNLKRTINSSSNNSYNLMKYNAVIMLKEILKHTSKYLNDDVKERIFKKALQCSKPVMC
jgi:hypothetical protein